MKIKATLKKIAGGLLLVGLIIPMAGCPYSSEFPIDEPSVKVESSWFGRYRGNFPVDYYLTDSVLAVSKKSNFEYLVTVNGNANGGVEDLEKNRIKNKENAYNPTEYIAHASAVGSATFLNVKESGGKYYLFEASKSGKSIILREITPVVQYKAFNGEELKELLKKNLDNDLLYGQTITMSKL